MIWYTEGKAEEARVSGCPSRFGGGVGGVLRCDVMLESKKCLSFVNGRWATGWKAKDGW